MTDKKKREKRKQQESILEQQIIAILRQCMKTTLDQVLDDLLKDFK